MLEGLDVVISKTQRTKDKRGDKHQPQINVAEVTDEQYRQYGGYNQHHATHSRYAFLGYIERVNLLVALLFADVLAFQESDEPFAEPHADDEGNHRHDDSAERDVGEEACTEHVVETGKE